jgi:hypothetical protein
MRISCYYLLLSFFLVSALSIGAQKVSPRASVHKRQILHKDLSETEKGTILAMSSQGYSHALISEAINDKKTPHEVKDIAFHLNDEYEKKMANHGSRKGNSGSKSRSSSSSSSGRDKSKSPKQSESMRRQKMNVAKMNEEEHKENREKYGAPDDHNHYKRIRKAEQQRKAREL